MKRNLALLLVFILTMGVLVACKGQETPSGPSNGEGQGEGEENKVNFEEVDGLLVYTDLENSPFEGSGLKISIKEGKDGYVEFIKTDLKGNETVDYYKFNYEDNMVEKYYYVSAMGTAYYYYYDLENQELAKVEDGDHKDSTDGMKKAGRWDGAAENMSEEVKSLEDYFNEHYGKTIKESVLND